MKFSVTMPGRTLTVTMNGVSPGVARLVPLRAECFLRPAFQDIVSEVETALGVTMPASLDAWFQGSPGLISSAASWHLHLPNGDLDGLRTAERILIQLAACAWHPAQEDAERLHAVVCPLIGKWIDPTFICVLELL